MQTPHLIVFFAFFFFYSKHERITSVSFFFLCAFIGSFFFVHVFISGNSRANAIREAFTSHICMSCARTWGDCALQLAAQHICRRGIPSIFFIGSNKHCVACKWVSLLSARSGSCSSFLISIFSSRIEFRRVFIDSSDCWICKLCSVRGVRTMPLLTFARRNGPDGSEDFPNSTFKDDDKYSILSRCGLSRIQIHRI